MGWCPLPHTSAKRAILGFLGRNGPCFLACSTRVSSLKMASHWSHPMAMTNSPNRTDSRTRMTECKILACLVNMASRDDLIESELPPPWP